MIIKRSTDALMYPDIPSFFLSSPGPKFFYKVLISLKHHYYLLIARFPSGKCSIKREIRTDNECGWQIVIKERERGCEDYRGGGAEWSASVFYITWHYSVIADVVNTTPSPHHISLAVSNLFIWSIFSLTFFSDFSLKKYKHHSDIKTNIKRRKKTI